MPHAFGVDMRTGHDAVLVAFAVVADGDAFWG
jgi:hypothetical protein